jgi:hypothetical protein
LPADLGATIASQMWNLDVTITSPTNQAVYNTTQLPRASRRVLHRSQPGSYVAVVGSPATVDMVSVRPDGTLYAGAELEVVVYEYLWSSVYEQAEDGNFYWKTSAERTPVYTTTVTTDDRGVAAFDFTPAKGGQYQVTATGEDTFGNTIRSAVIPLGDATGDKEFVAWPRHNNDRIELVADKKLYAPGETAKHPGAEPLQRPGQGAGDARTQRRDRIEQVFEFTGSSETIEIPVTAAHIPNIFVGVVIVAGCGRDQPLPGDARRLCQAGRGHRREGTEHRRAAFVRRGAPGRHRHLHADRARQHRRPSLARDEPGAGRQGGAQLAGNTAWNRSWSTSSTTSDRWASTPGR